MQIPDGIQELKADSLHPLSYLYLTKSAPENLATHWATSPFYLSHWMLIRRPNSAKQPAFQSLRLHGDETSRLAARHMLHPAAVHDTRFSHGGPPPSLIY